jgi:hypothetical protein
MRSPSFPILEQYRAFSSTQQIKLVDRIVQYDLQGILGNPLIYDSLGTTNRPIASYVQEVISRLPREDRALALQIDPFDHLPKDAFPDPREVENHSNQKKQDLYRLPVWAKVSKYFGGLSDVAMISLSGPNICICDSDEDIRLRPLAEYPSWTAAGGGAYIGITNNALEHSLNLLGFEHSLLPRPIFGDWETVISDAFLEVIVAEPRALFIHFDATCRIDSFLDSEVLSSTGKFLRSERLPWVMVVNTSNAGNEKSTGRYVHTVLSSAEGKLRLKRAGFKLLDRSPEQLITSKTKKMPMAAALLGSVAA